MDNNNITVQASLDTTQFKKDLAKFDGELNISADTKEIEKQIETALKNASKNNSISFKCTTPNLKATSDLVESARSQVQKLQGDFNALPQNLTLNVSVNSPGLDQYKSQLEHCLQLSDELHTIPLQSAIPKIETSSTFNSTFPNSNVGNISFEKANTEGKTFADTLANITNAATILTSGLQTPAAFKSFSESLD